MPKYEGKPTKAEKNIKTESKMPKDKKSPKIEENEHSIAARCLPSCHDGSCLLAKKTEEINLKKICLSQHDDSIALR
jgi:hypothetical protein